MAFELNNWGGGGQFAIELDNGVSQGHQIIVNSLTVHKLYLCKFGSRRYVDFSEIFTYHPVTL